MDKEKQEVYVQRKTSAAWTKRSTSFSVKKNQILLSGKKVPPQGKSARAHIDTLCTGSDERTGEVFATLTGFVVGETLPSEPTTDKASEVESEGQGVRTASHRECRDRGAQKDDSVSSASFSAAGRSSPRENVLG
jgi:hypothetical protein